jgi:hypothetical protein
LSVRRKINIENDFKYANRSYVIIDYDFFSFFAIDLSCWDLEERLKRKQAKSWITRTALKSSQKNVNLHLCQLESKGFDRKIQSDET